MYGYTKSFCIPQVNIVFTCFLYIFCLDIILQAIYYHHLRDKYSSYENFLNAFKFTNRQLSPNHSLVKILQHISWILGLNINVIGFKRTRNQKYQLCKNTSCNYLFYKFQNTTVKLLFDKSEPLTFFLFRNKVYLQSQSCKSLQPMLLQNYESLNNDQLQIITLNDICKILKSEHVELPYNLHIFSSYTYLNKQNEKNEKSIHKHLLGSYISNKNRPTFSIFLTPDVSKIGRAHV